MGTKKELALELEEKVAVTSGTAIVTVSPDELEGMLDALIIVDNITISINVGRTPKQYDSNKYFMSLSIPTGAAYQIKYAGPPEELRKAIAKKIMEKVGKGFNSMRAMLKPEMTKDGIDIHHLGEYETKR